MLIRNRTGDHLATLTIDDRVVDPDRLNSKVDGETSEVFRRNSGLRVVEIVWKRSLLTRIRYDIYNYISS